MREFKSMGPDDLYPTGHNTCRGCGKPLLPENRRIADGCECNSPRGVNHGLVAKNTCTCIECDPAQTGSTRYPPLPATEKIVGCKARVRDYTDLTDCGKPVLRAGLCSTHLHAEEDFLRDEIRKHEHEAARCRAKLAQLQTESG